MSELSSTVEDEPPISPVRTTRAKVVRESFTALRSDFEISTPPPVVRPQRQDTAPTTPGGGQSNLALTIGGGILLLGCMFAFLFFGYGSNKGNAGASKPVGAGGGTGVASAATTKDIAKTPAKAPVHAVHNAIKEPAHKPVPVLPSERHTAPVAPPREIAFSPAHEVALPRTHEFHQAEREPRPMAHERPIAMTPAKPAPHVEAPVHHTSRPEHASTPAVTSHHDDQGDSNPLHRLDND